MFELVDLIIELEVYSIEKKIISFSFKRDTQIQIDRETICYTREKDYFLKNKENIKRKLEIEKQKYGIVLNPVDIELLSIYLKKGEKKLKPLFQTYNTLAKSQNETYQLEDLIKKNLLQGALCAFYKLDKNARNQVGYQSFFENCPKFIIDYLELNLIDVFLINEVWTLLKQDPDFIAILRFLLIKPNEEKLKLEFQNIMKMRIKNKRMQKEEGPVRKILYSD